MKLTLASAKPIGLLIGTAISSALSGAIAGRAAAGQHLEAQPATSADIAALREHFDARFDSQAERLGTVEKHLAGVEGYMEAQKQAVLAKALSGRRE